MKKMICYMMAFGILFCSFVLAVPGANGGQAPYKVYASTEPIGISPMGGTPLTYISDRIDYAYKVEDEYVVPNGIPGYLSNLTCGISAGGVAIGYYDRYYEELIPNHTGKTFLGKWVYGSQDDEVDAMFSSLYTRMNGTPNGVTINGYLTGMQSYTASRGRTAAFTKTMGGPGQLNSAQYKAAIQSGKLLSIFLEGFTIIDIGDFRTYTNYDIIGIYTNSGAHVMTAYGYCDVFYYNENNQCFRTDSYLYVSSGYSTPIRCLVKLNQYCVIDDCYILDIT